MRVLIVGITGMLGHQLGRYLQNRFEVFGTVRTEDSAAQIREIAPQVTIVPNIFVTERGTLPDAIFALKPDIIINCIGVIKQSALAENVSLISNINTNFPIWLANECQIRGIQVIHFSTDCVFSGEVGNYQEADTPDPVDLYGATKLAGEVSNPYVTTIRTSFIGWELNSRLSLLEWAVFNKNKAVNGYAHALFSGLTTLEIARVVEMILLNDVDTSGIWHLAGPKISKLELLGIFNKKLDLNLTITPDNSVICDRSLIGSALSAKLSFITPTWEEMIEELTLTR
jgi:dTDP-4-dehydrorhamnose reductase